MLLNLKCRVTCAGGEDGDASDFDWNAQRIRHNTNLHFAIDQMTTDRKLKFEMNMTVKI